MNSQQAIRWLRDFQFPIVSSFSRTLLGHVIIIQQCYITESQRWCNHIFIVKRNDTKKFPAVSGTFQCLRSVSLVPNADVHFSMWYKYFESVWLPIDGRSGWCVYVYFKPRTTQRWMQIHKIVATWSNLLYISVASSRNASEYRYLLK